MKAMLYEQFFTVFFPFTIIVGATPVELLYLLGRSIALFLREQLASDDPSMHDVLMANTVSPTAWPSRVGLRVSMSD